MAFALAWVLADFIHAVLVLISAGSNPAISRASVVWFVRGFVVLEHTILALAVGPFWKENTEPDKSPTPQAVTEEE